MKVEVLGPGCKNCKTLAERVKKVAEEEGLEIDFAYIDDMNELAERGIALTPALMINGEAAVTGKVPSKEEIKNILSKN